MPKSNGRQGRGSRTLPTRAARLMKARYIQQLTQSSEKDKKPGAAEQVERAMSRVQKVVGRAVMSMAGSIIGLIGGGALLVILLAVTVVAALASSPFGLFFAAERTAPGALSVSEAVVQVNMAYNAKLEELQSGDYDGIEVTGQAADWPDVLAVFAAWYAAAEDGVDVATLDADRVSKLTAVFWDMTEIAYSVETIDHPDSDPEDETDDSWMETILHIDITARTAEDMKTAYSFTGYQADALDELLSDRAALASLAGSLTITNADVLEVLNALPPELSADRRKAVETALQLVGKVNYFWGGKSHVIGWDSRWGQLAKVTAPDSSTTGTYRPYGLDCSGFIDWTLRNTGLPSDEHWYIGTNLTEVTEADALPGDMALNGDASHIGLVVGRDSTGQLLICHCSAGANNVVVTGLEAGGFSVPGRPKIYEP